MIQISHLSKAYGAKQVLHHINLTLEPGRVYGIIGHNGAGKTTLFHSIAGLLSHQGEIHSPYDKLKNHIGLLHTHPIFMSYMTGAEYIHLLCHARDKKVPNLDTKNIFELPLNEYASTYSTGMKKKLALMAILLQQNDIYILDEPYNGVDIQSNMLITALIQRLRDQGKIILISSHIFSTLRDTCDVLYTLDQGHLSEAILPQDYSALEEKMKDYTVGSQIDQILGEH